MPAASAADPTLRAWRIRPEPAPQSVTKSVGVTVLPADPARLQRLSDGDATAAQAQIPDGLLAIRVSDSFGNAIPRLEVVFRRRGAPDKPQIKRTDAQGVAILVMDQQSELAGGRMEVDVQVLNTPRVRRSFRVVVPDAVAPSN